MLPVKLKKQRYLYCGISYYLMFLVCRTLDQGSPSASQLFLTVRIHPPECVHLCPIGGSCCLASVLIMGTAFFIMMQMPRQGESFSLHGVWPTFVYKQLLTNAIPPISSRSLSNHYSSVWLYAFPSFLHLILAHVDRDSPVYARKLFRPQERLVSTVYLMLLCL